MWMSGRTFPQLGVDPGLDPHHSKKALALLSTFCGKLDVNSLNNATISLESTQNEAKKTFVDKIIINALKKDLKDFPQ